MSLNIGCYVTVQAFILKRGQAEIHSKMDAYNYINQMSLPVIQAFIRYMQLHQIGVSVDVLEKLQKTTCSEVSNPKTIQFSYCRSMRALCLLQLCYNKSLRCSPVCKQDTSEECQTIAQILENFSGKSAYKQSKCYTRPHTGSSEEYIFLRKMTLPSRCRKNTREIEEKGQKHLEAIRTHLSLSQEHYFQCMWIG